MLGDGYGRHTVGVRSSDPDVLIPQLGVSPYEVGHEVDTFPVVHDGDLHAAAAQVLLGALECSALADDHLGREEPAAATLKQQRRDGCPPADDLIRRLLPYSGSMPEPSAFITCRLNANSF